MNIIHPVRNQIRIVENAVVVLDISLNELTFRSARCPGSVSIPGFVFDVIRAVILVVLGPDRSMYNRSAHFEGENLLSNILFLISHPHLLKEMPISLVVGPTSFFRLLHCLLDKCVPFVPVTRVALLDFVIVTLRP